MRSIRACRGHSKKACESYDGDFVRCAQNHRLFYCRMSKPHHSQAIGIRYNFALRRFYAHHPSVWNIHYFIIQYFIVRLPGSTLSGPFSAASHTFTQYQYTGTVDADPDPSPQAI
jgi:hypothetical protein